MNGMTGVTTEDPADVFAQTMDEFIASGMEPDEAIVEMQEVLKRNMIAYCHELIRAGTRDRNFQAFIKIQKVWS